MPLSDPELATIAANLANLPLDPVTHLRVVCAVVAPVLVPNAHGDGQDKKKPVASRRGADGRFASHGAAQVASAQRQGEGPHKKNTLSAEQARPVFG